jgi:hypothetical protein
MRSETTTLIGLVAYETGDFALAANPREPARYLGGWLVSANEAPNRSSTARSHRHDPDR